MVGQQTTVRLIDLVTGVPNQVGIGDVQFFLEPLDLSLEEGDGANAPVNRVPHPGFCLVGEGIHRIFPLVREELVEEFGHIARAEDFVDVGELCWFLWREVRGENAAGHALAAEELAGCTGGAVGVVRRSHFQYCKTQVTNYEIYYVFCSANFFFP